MAESDESVLRRFVAVLDEYWKTGSGRASNGLAAHFQDQALEERRSRLHDEIVISLPLIAEIEAKLVGATPRGRKPRPTLSSPLAGIMGQAEGGHATTEIRSYLLNLAGRSRLATVVPRKRAATSIFLGHGRSLLWMKLQAFLSDRLQLEVSEYSLTSIVGLSRKEILLELLDGATFAFLIMTAEDEHGDGTRHARENVVHEVGLFQGRLGFERAIVLLEEGCEVFSNITGVEQLRFPAGDILARAEEIRDVLTREGVLRSSAT